MLEFGQKFYEYRTKYRITLREISQQTNLSISELSDLEHGRAFFTPKIVHKLQNAINKNKNFLVHEFNKYCQKNSSKTEIDGQTVDIVIFAVYGDAIALIKNDNAFIEGNLSVYKYALTKVAEKYFAHCEFCSEIF